MIYVAELTYYDPALEEEVVVLFSTKGFATGPADTPANRVAEGRISSAALIRRDIFDIATTGGASRVGYGELALRNDDGGLDYLLEKALDGRSCRIYVSAADPADRPAFPAGFDLLLAAVMEQPDISLSEARIRLRDRQVFTSRQLQPNRFAGDNVLPAGLEGIASDLRGKPKPILYGYAFNLAPPAVNTSRLVFQVNDGPVRDVMAVYDSGALLSRGEDYADETALFATAPAAGSYRVWKAGGMFRLGSSPIGEVTCDAVEGLWPVNRTAGQAFRKILEDRVGLDAGLISSADVAALDAVQPATVGLWIDRDVPVAAALDLVCQSVGAWWASDVNGVLRIARLEAPGGAPVLELNASNIVGGSLSRVPMNDGGLPAYRVTVRAVPNYTVQTSGLVGSVTPARRSRLAKPFQDAIAEELDTRDVYLLAPERTVETLLACLPAAQVEATRLLGLYGVRRDRFELTFEGDPEALTTIDLGAVVRVTYSRFGLESGRLMRVLGYQLNPTASSATLTVWG